jgi:uroporphyrinogen-III synthase
MPHPSFNGLCVLSLESRRAAEIAKLIRTYGGEPIVVPALREIPPESNQQTLAFVADLMDGKIDMVIFLTGVGVRALMEIVETKYDREDFLRVLRMMKIASRGPKPTAALRELKVPIHLNVPEPSTWRELTQKLEQDFGASLPSLRVAVQEYGTSNPDLLSWLSGRCEAVTRVAVYQWALPEDIQPLRECVMGLVEGLVDVVLFTTSVQVVHLFEVARQMECEEMLRTSLAATAIFSIGPTTTEELKRRGLTPDLEPAHPKMGFLVNEAAQHASSLLQQRREKGVSGPRTAVSRPASQRAEVVPAGAARATAPAHKPVAGEMEFLHDIGRRMAAADPIHTVLQRIVDFVLAVIPCDSCFIYVLEREELVLRASKNPHADLVDHLGIRLGQGITGWVAEHREPVAISSKAMHDARFKIFKDLPEDQFEALLSCPILCANRVVGVINLQHRRPYHHKPEQVRLLSMIGFLVGAEIERARLEDENVQLVDRLETRKAVERAKGILQRALGIDEDAAYRTMIRESRQRRKPMREIAEAIIMGEDLRRPASE